MQVPLLDLTRQYTSLKNEIDEAVAAVLGSGRYILGENVAAFEEEAARYCGVRFGIGVANGTDALLLTLRALDVGPGDQVIVPSFTFFATAEVVTLLGATPVFVDIDPETFNLDSQGVKRALSPATKAIIPVHLFGQPADMDEILEIAAEHGLRVVEDACQAIGAEYRGRKAGAMGAAGCFSFFPSKNLGCFGDGGLVVTDDARLAERIRELRNHGSRERYYHKHVGYNSRLDEIQAAILRVKLRRLDGWNQTRKRVASIYDDLIAGAGLSPRVQTPRVKGDRLHVFHQYTLRVTGRDDLRNHLTGRGVGTAVYYPLPLHLQEAYQALGYTEGALPVTEAASREVLSLPMFPEITVDEQQHIVRAMAEFYRATPSG